MIEKIDTNIQLNNETVSKQKLQEERVKVENNSSKKIVETKPNQFKTLNRLNG